MASNDCSPCPHNSLVGMTGNPAENKKQECELQVMPTMHGGVDEAVIITSDPAIALVSMHPIDAIELATALLNAAQSGDDMVTMQLFPEDGAVLVTSEDFIDGGEDMPRRDNVVDLTKIARAE
jgi:hypothetical protein